MMLQSKITDYKFTPRADGTEEEVKAYCTKEGWENAKCPASSVYAVQKMVNRKKQQVIIYTNQKVRCMGEGNPGPVFRKWDLQNDNENIIVNDKTTPTCAELNFKHTIIGSDEVGTGERFKRSIVTAVEVKPEQMDELIGMNVNDSKQMGEGDIRNAGERLSGLSPQQVRELIERGETRVTSGEGAFVRFKSTILPNDEYDKFRIENSDKNKNYLLAELHAELLNALIKEGTPDYVVVDDFIETHKSVRIAFYQALDTIDEKKIFLRTKADAVNMAVSCASVISSYFSQIYMEWLAEKIKKDYGIRGSFTIPEQNLGLEKQKKALADAGADAEEVLKKYTKTTFKSK